MAPESAALLWDALNAARAVQTFVAGKSFERYRSEDMLSSAVERKLEIVGEALNQWRKLDPATAAQLPQVTAAVGLRNVLIHGYASVDHRLVWDVAVHHVPLLIAHIERWLPSQP
jgi:uncharacterized protein with HEPN domain